MLKVCAIMPTADRARFIPQALAGFLAQTYPEKTLVVLDNGRNLIQDFVPQDDPRVLYHALSWPAGQNIGQLRNLACQLAPDDTDVFIHFDDDDWSQPARIARQVEELEDRGVQVTGFHAIHFYRESDRSAWTYKNRAQHGVGASLCYRRGFWQDHPFPEQGLIHDRGEDNGFMTTARQAQAIGTSDGRGLLVARIHAASFHSNRPLTGNYVQVSLDELPEGFPR